MSENDRLAEIKARCEAYGVEVKALLAENERLRRDNGSLAKGYAEQLGDRQENIMLRAEAERLRAENAALAGERDRLREALEDIASREWEYFEDSSKPRGVGDAYCTRCLSTGPTVASVVHADDCPFAALKEPTDAD